VSPGALQVQPVMIKKVVKLLSNLGLDVVFGKRRGIKLVRSRRNKQRWVLFHDACTIQCFVGLEIKSIIGRCNPMIFGCFWLFQKNDKFGASTT
jgi:hypothetical protein